MTIIHDMGEELVELENGTFQIMGRVDVSEEEPRFSVFHQISSKDRIELALEIRFLATNPIGIDDVIVGTATAFGICVAGRLTRKTAKEAIKCYRQSKKDNPGHSILDHAKEAGACVAQKGGVMKGAATDALVDCLKLPKDDDDDDSDDQT